MLAKLFKRKVKATSRQMSIVIQPSSVTVAVKYGEEKFIKQLPCQNRDYVSALQKIAEEFEFEDAQCQIVLTYGLYQTAQVDKPNVPENEWAQALIWSAKDLFTIAPANQLLEFYQHTSNNTNNNKLNIVACDKELLQPIIDCLIELEVDVKAISIEDIVLTQLVKEESANILVFHAPGTQLLLAIMKNGELCFSRHINGYENLHQLSEVDFEAGKLNNLSLEIQRSIDYAIGQLKLERISKIIVSVQNFASQQIVDTLQEMFDVNVTLLASEAEDEFSRFPINIAALDELKLELSAP